MKMFFAVLTIFLAFLARRSTSTEPTTEVPFNWQSSEEGIASALPEEIDLDFSGITRQSTKLHLTKKPDDVEHVQVITRHRGKERDWKLKKKQHLNVYSDLNMQASFSVAMNERDPTKLEMFGSFVSGNDTFSVSPSIHSFHPGQFVSISGTVHVVSKDEPTDEKLNYDNLGAQGYDDDDYHDGYYYIMSEMDFKISNRLYANRGGRQGLTIELFVVLDYSIYKKWLDHCRGRVDDAISGLRFYYAHILNGINDRYEAINIPDTKISVKPAGYYIARSRAEAPFTEDAFVRINTTAVNAYKALDNFYKWILKRVKSNHNDLPRFDASALFTEYLLMSVDNGVRSISGLADIGALCKINSVSINKDFGQYGAIDTATHELGHNLGAQHDGTNNTCTSNDQFIMASSPFATPEQTFFNPYKFSSCSKKYFQDYIAQLNRVGRNCMLDGGSKSNQDHDDHLRELPGRRFTPEDQCKLLYGKDSFYCAGGGDHGKSLCRGMFCWKPGANSCLTDVRLRAADGTSCNNKSWCLGSKCVYDERAPEFDVACPHGDYKDKIPFWNTGKVECKEIEKQVPHLCYHQYYENLCCDTCRRLKQDVPDCEYGDRNKTACAVIRSNYCYDESMQYECCETCVDREIEIDHPDCKYGDKASWCSNKEQFRASDCYRSGDSNLCCKTCLELKIGPPGCEYGDRGYGCKREHCLSPSHRLYCCRTCENYLNEEDITKLIQTTTMPTTVSMRTITVTQTPVIKEECEKDKASWCSRISAHECYRSNKTCCITCQAYYNSSHVDCEYGDKNQACGPEKCSLGVWYTDNCCRSCRAGVATSTQAVPLLSSATTATTTTSKLTTTTGKPTTSSQCPSGDRASWCPKIKPLECYRSSVICCSTCLGYFNDSIKNCPYGDKRSDCRQSDCSGPLSTTCCQTCHSASNTTTTSSLTTVATTAITDVSLFDFKSCKADNKAWCPQLERYECYMYFQDCCKTCGKYNNKSFTGCEFGDKETKCTVQLCNDTAYSKTCCKTCMKVKSEAIEQTTSVLTTTSATTLPSTNPRCPRGDTASWCSRIKSYECYRSSHICCSTCPKYLDESSKGCQYGDKRDNCDAMHCNKHSYSYYCCKTCNNNASSFWTTESTAKSISTSKTTILSIIPSALSNSLDTIPLTMPFTTKPTTQPFKMPDEEYIKQQCPMGDRASWCVTLKSYDCYRSSKICCETCLKFYDEREAEDECEYGDKVSWCENHVKKSAEDCKVSTSSVATKCCKSCKEALQADPNYLTKLAYTRPVCSHGDEASFCRDIEPVGCYSHHKKCCRTCAAYFDSTIIECPYGDKATWCKLHATSPESCNRRDIASNCCHSCFYLTTNGNITLSVGNCDDVAEWCRNISAHQCYQSRAEFTCCSTCKKFRKDKTGDCRYGDRVSWCEPQFCSSYPEECCETCA